MGIWEDVGRKTYNIIKDSNCGQLNAIRIIKRGTEIDDKKGVAF